jgi:hypothetical protein
MKKQNDAVFEATVNVTGKNEFASGALSEVTKDEKAQIIDLVTEGILQGEVAFSDEAKAKFDTDAKVRAYVVGMVSNHFRKDKRLNGGAKYETKAPGSRAGSGDEQLKNLKALLSTLTSEEDKAAVSAEIEARKKTLQVAKAKTSVKEINWDLIPEHLRNLAM